MNARVKIEHIHCIFITFCVFIFIASTIFVRNPDSDSFFLINTGDIILKNNYIPITNTWVVHEGFNVIIQQWVACIINYIMYNYFGDNGLIILAFIFVIIFNVVLNMYLRLFTKDGKLQLLLHLLLNIMVMPFMTTRPSIITICIILLELITLEKYNDNSIDKSILFIRMIMLSVIQINWQSSLWIVTIIMILPYLVPPIWNISDTDLLKVKDYLYVIALMFISALINPNWINGIRYLFISYGVITDNLDINELNPPEVKSLFGIYIVITIIFLTIYLCKGYKNKVTVYLSLGCILLASMHIRNNWMLLLPLVRLTAETLNIKFNNRIEGYTTRTNRLFIIMAYIAFGFMMSVIILSTAVDEKQKDNATETDEAADYLDTLDKDTIVLYTELGNGNYMQFRGYKVFIDGRIETHSDIINNKKDILTTYKLIRLGAIDFDKFIEEYQFTHLIVDKYTQFDIYLQYGDKYRTVIETDTYRLYELKGY